MTATAASPAVPRALRALTSKAPVVHSLPAIDRYIENAKPFAQPILMHLREAIHRAAPEAEEEIKWSRPFFVYRGVILGNLSAFKAHCSFGLWGGEMATVLRESGIASKEGMGSFGRITSLDDLPPASELDRLIRTAAAMIDDGARTKSIQRVAKPSRGEPEVPPELAAGLAKNKTAAKQFAGMSPSCRREYCDWIAGAKREETRTKRLATALEWIAEGKSHNWKYERPA